MQNLRHLHFYPRPPGGGRLSKRRLQACRISVFLSTPSGWRATRSPDRQDRLQRISIHALRVEGDPPSRSGLSGVSDFYPRPPGGGRPGIDFVLLRAGYDFYPRPPGGGRRQVDNNVRKNLFISIHALRVEGDYPDNVLTVTMLQFLSTPSGWRATVCPYALCAARMKFLSTPSGWRATA